MEDRSWTKRGSRRVFHFSQSRNNDSASYEVRAITHGGRNIKLVSGLDTSEQALFVEQEIEKLLSLQDVPVKGAIGS